MTQIYLLLLAMFALATWSNWSLMVIGLLEWDNQLLVYVIDNSEARGLRRLSVEVAFAISVPTHRMALALAHNQLNSGR